MNKLWYVKMKSCYFLWIPEWPQGSPELPIPNSDLYIIRVEVKGQNILFREAEIIRWKCYPLSLQRNKRPGQPLGLLPACQTINTPPDRRLSDVLHSPVLAPLVAAEQRLHSELLSDIWAPHMISQTELIQQQRKYGESIAFAIRFFLSFVAALHHRCHKLRTFPKHCRNWFLLIWPDETNWWHKSLPSVSHIQTKRVQMQLADGCFPRTVWTTFQVHSQGSVYLFSECRVFFCLFVFLLSCLHAPSLLRTCQKTLDSSSWWRHASTSSRQMRMSSHLPRVTSSACLVRRKVAGGRELSMAGLGGFLATMSVKSKALVGVFTFMRHLV